MLFLLASGAVAAWEWSKLAGLDGWKKYFYVAAACLALMLAFWLDGGFLKYLGLGWLIAPWLILGYSGQPAFWPGRLQLSVAGLLILVVTGASLLELRQQPDAFLLLTIFLLLVAAADTAAYLVGSRFGKHKLRPQVSPNKTWEGFFAGTVMVCLIVVLWWQRFEPALSLLWVIGFAFVIASCCLVGDLTVSVLKRRRGLKKTGALLPGHGGILDRLDSSLAVAPVYAMGIAHLQS